jgi:molecular chaperone DnaK (HSP70)
VEIVKNEIEKNTTPSVVYFDDDKHIFGEPAIYQSFFDPQNCVSGKYLILAQF